MPVFKVRFVKVTNILGAAGRPQVLQFAEKTIHTQTEKLSIGVPDGYQLATITEILPDEYEKAVKGN